jgi:serine protease Do
VISDASEITVSFEDGTQYPAKLVGSNASSDIAMLKVEATGLRPVTIGKSSNLAVGDQVVVIGNALGELSFSLTVGYVSGMDRNVTTDGSVMNMLQTDAAINSGNSGGPMFNARGEVIGINTAKYSGTTTSGASIEGIGFAIPMDDVLGMLEDLRDFGYIKGASMGVYVTNVDSATAEMYNLPLGVYIKEVIADSAAQKAGIQAKDIVVELGGYEIKNTNDLTRALRHFEGGQTATVTVWRSGVEMILTITFDEKTE